MKRTRFINFRVTTKQYELIQLRKECKGYISLSQFIRDLLLSDEMINEKRIREIHEIIVQKK
ncbi:hypothetical protein K9L97_01230 [Candidatus Woesearchaeota archaeon]|nr:hypothetical protein [Candidatus Woesearchaeota archaeon]